MSLTRDILVLHGRQLKLKSNGSKAANSRAHANQEMVELD